MRARRTSQRAERALLRDGRRRRAGAGVPVAAVDRDPGVAGDVRRPPLALGLHGGLGGPRVPGRRGAGGLPDGVAVEARLLLCDGDTVDAVLGSVFDDLSLPSTNAGELAC